MLPEMPEIVPTWNISVLSLIISSNSALVAPPKTRLSPVVVAIPAIETTFLALMFCIQSIGPCLYHMMPLDGSGYLKLLPLTLFQEPHKYEQAYKPYH